jgi:hypothetical protein
MGQYHYPANLDRLEYLDPLEFGDGLKLVEFGFSGSGTMAGLAVLLAAQNKGGARGGGDLTPRSLWNEHANGVDQANPAAGMEDYLLEHVVGRWAGSKVAILGDYPEPGEVGFESSPHSPGGVAWKDVSHKVLAALCLDGDFTLETLRKQVPDLRKKVAAVSVF